MKSILLTTFTLLLSNLIIAQGINFSSIDDSYNLWDDEPTWTKDVTWGRSSPGYNINGSTASVNIYGRVETSRGVTVGGGSVLNVYDTLRINGDLQIKQGARVVVHQDGFVIVAGEIDASGGVEFINNSMTVVAEDVNSVRGAKITNNNTMYSMGQTNSSGGGQISNNIISGPNAQTPEVMSMLDTQMPVEWLYIESSNINGNRTISWATSSEENNDYFVVQASKDAKDWFDVGVTQGAGNSDVELHYSMRHSSNQELFYRVMQVDYDGKFDFSKIIFVQGSKISKAYPNPAYDVLSLDVFEDSAKISIVSMNGSVIKTFSLNEQGTHRLDVSDVAPGLYLMRINQMTQKINIL